MIDVEACWWANTRYAHSTPPTQAHATLPICALLRDVTVYLLLYSAPLKRGGCTHFCTGLLHIILWFPLTAPARAAYRAVTVPTHLTHPYPILEEEPYNARLAFGMVNESGWTTHVCCALPVRADFAAPGSVPHLQRFMLQTYCLGQRIRSPVPRTTRDHSAVAPA